MSSILLLLIIPRFVDFGSSPCFLGLWELASTTARVNQLKEAYAQFVKLYSADLSLPGPYLEARSTTTFDSSKDAPMSVGKTGYEGHVNFNYPISMFAAMHLLS